MDSPIIFEGFLTLWPKHPVNDEGDPVVKLSYRLEEMIFTVSHYQMRHVTHVIWRVCR